MNMDDTDATDKKGRNGSPSRPYGNKFLYSLIVHILIQLSFPQIVLGFFYQHTTEEE